VDPIFIPRAIPDITSSRDDIQGRRCSPDQ
jgi:hypothetical protein